MINLTSISLLFIFAITLHNIEEALWLPQWSKHAQKFRKQVSKDEFHFAVLVITILSYLATGLFIFFPQNLISKYIFFGFVGTMIGNIIFPHLVASIVLKKYCPGLITGVLLIVPFNSLIIVFSINNGIISLSEIIISTIVVAISLLTLIPRLEKISTSLINYE